MKKQNTSKKIPISVFEVSKKEIWGYYTNSKYSGAYTQFPEHLAPIQLSPFQN